MEKKFYVTPEMEEVEMDSSLELMTISSEEPGIGYGGEDETGEIDPS